MSSPSANPDPEIGSRPAPSNRPTAPTPLALAEDGGLSELGLIVEGVSRTLRNLLRDPATAPILNGLEGALSAIDEARQVIRQVLSLCGPLVAPEGACVGVSDRRVCDMVRDVLKELSALADEQGVLLQLECDSLAAGIRAGPLEPILWTSVRNAIEACGRGAAQRSSDAARQTPMVVVALWCNGPHLIIDVLDNGPGLHGGGLTSVQRVVAGLGGSMELSNVPFGQGAIFRAEIPIARLMQRVAA